MADMMIDRPEWGQAIRTSFPSPDDNRKIILNFLTENAEISRVDNSLVFTFEDGASLELENFYVEFSKENLPQFQIGGRLVAGMDFFESFAPEITPAMGVGISSRGGRYTDFIDSDLINGLKHLDGLNENFNLTSSDSDSLDTLQPLAFAATTRKGQGTGKDGTDVDADGPPLLQALPFLPETPAEPPRFLAAPPPPANAYDVRAVLHSDYAQTGDHVDVSKIGQGANSIALNGWAAFGTTDIENYLTPSLVGGALVFTLTEAGRLACTASPSPLEGYYSVTGNDGQEHVVQIIVPQNENVFQSASFSSLYGADAWYATHRIQGETHYGHGNGGEGYSITASDRQDDVNIAGSIIFSSAISTGDGDDTVTIPDVNLGNVVGGSTVAVSTGDGHDMLTVKGYVEAVDNSTVNISTGNGNDVLTFEDVEALDNGTVNISAGDGDDVLTFGTYLYAGADSAVDINAGNGDDTLTVDRGAWALGGSALHINAGDGGDVLAFGMDIYAEDGTVHVETGKGGDILTIGGKIEAQYDGAVLIETGEGDDIVSIGGKIDTSSSSGNAVTIDLGEGDDILRIGGLIQDNGDNVSIRGGEGTDVLFRDMLVNDFNDLDALLSSSSSMEIAVSSFSGVDFSIIPNLADIGIHIRADGKIDMATSDWDYVSDSGPGGHVHYEYKGGEHAYDGIIASVAETYLANG
ncbi:MAG: hypothetical protein LBC94_09490 [Desulfovibrio sp.]|nr:hypothetical protein [Desulfovibrio sp.]